MTTTDGLVLHRAGLYDLTVWFFTRGREGRFRERLLDLAHLRLGEAVLDVGCGTGTQAIAAKRRVGGGGVHGLDASAEMLVRAVRKAARAGVEVVFERGPAQALPFGDGTFDVVLNTVMLHHLPKPARRLAAREMLRVLRPGGRVLAVDFASPSRGGHGLLAHLHRHGATRHGHTPPEEMRALFTEAGFAEVDGGSVGMYDLQFVRGRRGPGVTG